MDRAPTFCSTNADAVDDGVARLYCVRNDNDGNVDYGESLDDDTHEKVYH